MATTSPYSGRERHHAERLSGCSGLTRAKIEQTTGIPLNTLSRWAKAEDWAQRRDTYRALALSVPEIMQAHALKMQAWAEDEKEKAGTPRELNASVESGNKAMYALCLADQAYRAHAKMNHLDEIYLDDYETPKWAKTPTLVEQDFTRIQAAYYPALREGGSRIIVHNISLRRWGSWPAAKTIRTCGVLRARSSPTASGMGGHGAIVRGKRAGRAGAASPRSPASGVSRDRPRFWPNTATRLKTIIARGF